MSTNDTVVIMANGMAKNSPIRKKGKEFSLFTEALTQLCRDLACQIVKDGEGRTKFIEINVLGAKTQAQAKEMGLAVANSFLVKTAAFGNNPNWGRVVAAVGAVGIPEVTENNLKVEFSDFSKKDIAITIKLNLGRASAKIFTSDLSYEYVKINVEYN